MRGGRTGARFPEAISSGGDPGAVILVECAVLALNGGRCPLTDWAARYTADRASNFDIYLPEWLAHHNKQIFGTLFVAGEALLGALWWRQRQRASPDNRFSGT